MEKTHDLQNNSQDTESHQWKRRGADRRVFNERRSDRRNPDGRKRSLMSWIKSLINPRLGVDRRKGGDQRRASGSEKRELESLLSPEEIDSLLK